MCLQSTSLKLISIRKILKLILGHIRAHSILEEYCKDMQLSIQYIGQYKLLIYIRTFGCILLYDIIVQITFDFLFVKEKFFKKI